MKNIYKLVIFLALLFPLSDLKAQYTCMQPPTLSLGVYDYPSFAPISAVISCTNTNLINISPNSWVSGNTATSPCIRLIVGLTNANATSNNSVAIGQGTNTNIYDMCASGCNTTIPNSSSYTMSLFFVDPSQSHGYNLCHTNAAATNMQYTVCSCYSSVPLASGTWTNTNAGGCQTVTIPANSALGAVGYTVSPAIAPTASYNANTGDLFLDPNLMSQGIYTISYSFSNQATPSCSAIVTRTISITNPYSATWTTPAAMCANGACVNLVPQITGSAGGTFTATAGVGTNSFCPSLVGAGTFPVTYTVGITPECGRAVTNTITVNPVPTANAGPTKSITCANTQTVLSGSGGPSYTWSGPGIVSGGATANPTVSLGGTYSLTVVSGGCTSAPSTVLVSVNTTSPPATASSSGSITCVNNVISLSAGPAAMNYTWSVPAGCTVSPANSATPSGTGSCTYTVLVMNPANGCTKTATVSPATNMTVAAASATTSGVITCTSTSFNLSSSPSGAMSYSWVAPGGGSITGGTTFQNTTGSGSGTYSVIVRDVVTGCPTTATCAPAVNTSTTFGTAAASTGTITCASTTVNLSVTGSGISSYTWTAPAGASVSPPNSATPV
jgi:hypothetical protein